jgi:hypothetical protein
MPGLDNMPLARYLIARKLEALLQGRDAEEIMEAKTGKKRSVLPSRRGGKPYISIGFSPLVWRC